MEVFEYLESLHNWGIFEYLKCLDFESIHRALFHMAYIAHIYVCLADLFFFLAKLACHNKQVWKPHQRHASPTKKADKCSSQQYMATIE